MEQIEKISNILNHPYLGYLNEEEEKIVNDYFNNKIDIYNFFKICFGSGSTYYTKAREYLEISNKTYYSLIQLGKTHTYSLIKENQTIHILLLKNYPMQWNKVFKEKTGIDKNLYI